MKRENTFGHTHHRINHDRQEIADEIAKAQIGVIEQQPLPIHNTFCADVYGCHNPHTDCLTEERCIHQCYRDEGKVYLQ